jgi:hypothetical protein
MHAVSQPIVYFLHQGQENIETISSAEPTVFLLKATSSFKPCWGPGTRFSQLSTTTSDMGTDGVMDGDPPVRRYTRAKHHHPKLVLLLV